MTKTSNSPYYQEVVSIAGVEFRGIYNGFRNKTKAIRDSMSKNEIDLEKLTDITLKRFLIPGTSIEDLEVDLGFGAEEIQLVVDFATYMREGSFRKFKSDWIDALEKYVESHNESDISVESDAVVSGELEG